MKKRIIQIASPVTGEREWQEAKESIMFGSRINGGVKIGQNCWIVTGSMIREGVNVGDNSMIGMGSIAVKDADEESTVMGSSAREMEN